MDGIGNFRNITPKGISKTFDEKKTVQSKYKAQVLFHRERAGTELSRFI